jgi:hypothetical protein
MPPGKTESPVTENLTMAFAIVLLIAAAAGAARRFSPPGTRRNALSVILVVSSLIAMFLFCFGLGSLVRPPQAAPTVSTTTAWPPRAILRL